MTQKQRVTARFTASEIEAMKIAIERYGAANNLSDFIRKATIILLDRFRSSP